MRYILLLSILAIAFVNCNQGFDEKGATTDSTHLYPPEKGFDLDNSDVEALAVADSVMVAMGGYQNWKETRYLSWNFFGRRSLLWDKWTGNVRIEIPKDSTIILLNVNDSTGKAMQAGVEITNPDTLQQKFLNEGVTIWINDSYWLVMPFKLKDSGVTLKYIGETTTVDSIAAHQLQLTFDNVGLSPEHKYNVYVDKSTQLVCRWDYFDNYGNEEPRFSTPWQDYSQHGNIKLSGNRGRGALTDIEVLEEVDEQRFTEF